VTLWQSGSGSQLGITFIDGTVFALASNARMVLDEMVYDPNGTNNSSLLSLVQGTISFVAGETAKQGDMKISTRSQSWASAAPRFELCGILGDEANQAAWFAGTSMTSMPFSNLTPAMTFGN